MELPSIGDIVGVEITSGGAATGQVVEVEVLHVHVVRRTGRVQVQVRSLAPVRIGRMVGRKVDYSPKVATQYVDQQWLRERPAPAEPGCVEEHGSRWYPTATKVEYVEEVTQMTAEQMEAIAKKRRSPRPNASMVAAVAMAGALSVQPRPKRTKKG